MASARAKRRIHCLPMELIFLYRENYLKQIGKDLGFPVINNSEIIKKVLCDESNKKYIHEVEEQPLDKEIKKESIEES